MQVVVSTRALLLLRNSISGTKLSEVYRRVPFRRHLRLFSRGQGDNGPLTLASLGLQSEIEIKGVEKSDIPLMVSAFDVPRGKEKKISVTGSKSSLQKKPLELEVAPFAAKSFSELGLPPLLVERLEKEGFEVPTDVQAAAIPTIVKNHDVMIQSYTGSGKTLAYVLPILTEVGPLKRVFLNDKGTRNRIDVEAVIVAPSRELAMQIVREVERLLGPVHKKLVQQLVGGANKSRQEEALKKNKPAIVVGTPGRIAEISKTGKLHTHDCRYLVLDEVDELLSFNFREDMHRILEHVGRRPGAGTHRKSDSTDGKTDRQTIMVSATVPLSVIRAARNWSYDPVLVQANNIVPLESISRSAISPTGSSPNSNSTTSQNVAQSLPPSLEHYYCVSRLQHKVDTLRRCVHALDAKYVIAFMNHTKQLKDAVFKLEARGIKAAELHGDLNKLVRSTILKNFRNGEVRVLVTNELSARGLDIPECDLVVNLGLPTDSVHYAHRAGRTGRLGRKGTVVTICEEPEIFVVRKLQKQLGVPIQACEFTEGKLNVTGEEEALAAARR
ncbi:hypothetical protein Leryth_022769 [Lithospermum erythrorhizon]|nr:hypothetical protein Leryth_022769 [Lithospermum erythrorhizon]